MLFSKTQERSPVVIIQPFDLTRETAVHLPDAAKRLNITVAAVKKLILVGCERKGAPRPGMQIRVIQLQACYTGDCMVTSVESIVRFSDKMKNSYGLEEMTQRPRPDGFKVDLQLASAGA